jgi:hypothetical protein
VVTQDTERPPTTLVNSWAFANHNANGFEFTLGPRRWISHGNRFDMGDRRLRALRPPGWNFQPPEGLLDEGTGFYWAVDGRCPMPDARCPMPDEPTAKVERPDSREMGGDCMFAHNAVSPLFGLGFRNDATAHSPRITESMID